MKKEKKRRRRRYLLSFIMERVRNDVEIQLLHFGLMISKSQLSWCNISVLVGWLTSKVITQCLSKLIQIHKQDLVFYKVHVWNLHLHLNYQQFLDTLFPPDQPIMSCLCLSIQWTSHGEKEFKSINTISHEHNKKVINLCPSTL